MSTAGSPRDQGELRRLEQRLSFYRLLSAGLFLAAAVAYGILAGRWIQDHALGLGLVQVDRRAPQARRVAELIKPLRYSIIPILSRDDVRIELDFPNKKWFLRNIHQFDPAGKIKLEEGRYGVCGHLAAYAHDQLKPLLGPQYSVEFLQVAQSGFFPAYITEHFALEITDRSANPPEVFILDPSLKRYGPKSQFEDYLSIERLPNLDFMETQGTDQAFRLGAGVPIEITGRYLVVLSVSRQAGIFDPKNFVVSLVAFHRYHYLGRPLLFLRNVDGQKESLEYPDNIRRVLGDRKFGRLRAQLARRFNEL
jgi:hypothetical protein